MSSLPADIWRLILGHAGTPSLVGLLPRTQVPTARSLQTAMDMLTICRALQASHEIMANEDLAALVAAHWAEAVQILLVHAEIDMEEKIARDRRTYHWERNRYFARVSDRLDLMVPHEYPGETTRFYWRIGMSHPEVLLCEYDVEDIRKDIIARCKEELDKQQDEDEDEDEDSDPCSAAYADIVMCLVDVVEQHYPFDHTKLTHRLKSHLLRAQSTGLRGPYVQRCMYPECTLCKGPLPEA